MKKYTIAILLITFLAACQSTDDKPDSTHLQNLQWIDLTHTFDSSTLYWPNNPTGFQKHTEAEGRTPLGFYYSSYSICAPEHGGTHLDAPVHFAEGRLSVEALPLSSLTGAAVVVDVSNEALANRDYLISVVDLEKWERVNGKIEAGTMVLFRTGYGKFYPDRAAYFGTARLGVEAIPELHFPGIDSSAATWLVGRKVKAVGLDTPSLDYGQSKDFKTHQIIMGADIPGFENVANLDKLPPRGSYIVALPMKIGGGSGGPLRIIAGLPAPGIAP